MKKINVLSLLSISSILLCGCNSKKLSQEEYQEELKGVQEALVIDNDKLDNVHINSRLNVEHYDYIEGEFYAYRQFALILIIPINMEDYTWKDGDKYYHYKATTANNGQKSEITKEQFDNYMATGRQTILNKLMEPYNLNLSMMSDETSDIYKDRVNTYSKQGSELNFKCVYNAVKSDETLEKTTVNIKYKDFLPIKYTSKSKDSNTRWDYKYGSASFTFNEDGSNSN